MTRGPPPAHHCRSLTLWPSGWCLCDGLARGGNGVQWAAAHGQASGRACCATCRSSHTFACGSHPSTRDRPVRTGRSCTRARRSRCPGRRCLASPSPGRGSSRVCLRRFPASCRAAAAARSRSRRAASPPRASAACARPSHTRCGSQWARSCRCAPRGSPRRPRPLRPAARCATHAPPLGSRSSPSAAARGSRRPCRTQRCPHVRPRRVPAADSGSCRLQGTPRRAVRRQRRCRHPRRLRWLRWLRWLR